MSFHFACTLSCVQNSPVKVTAYMMLCLCCVVEAYNWSMILDYTLTQFRQVVEKKDCASSNEAESWLDKQGGELEWIKHDGEIRIV